MADTYLRSKFLARLSQHQQLLRSRINPEKYWGFVEHLQDHLKVTGLDIELRQVELMGNTSFRINLEIYFEKNPQINYKMMREIFQLYFYEPHDVNFGQDFIFITLRDEPIIPQPIQYQYPLQMPPPSSVARTSLNVPKYS